MLTLTLPLQSSQFEYSSDCDETFSWNDLLYRPLYGECSSSFKHLNNDDGSSKHPYSTFFLFAVFFFLLLLKSHFIPLLSKHQIEMENVVTKIKMAYNKKVNAFTLTHNIHNNHNNNDNHRTNQMKNRIRQRT